MVPANGDPVPRVKSRIVDLRDVSPAAIVQFDPIAPSVTGSRARVVLFDGIDDHGATDDARCCRRRFPAAATELVADHATNDRAEYGTTARVALAHLHLIDTTHGAAGVAALRIVAAWRRRTVILRRRRTIVLRRRRTVVRR